MNFIDLFYFLIAAITICAGNYTTLFYAESTDAISGDLGSIERQSILIISLIMSLILFSLSDRKQFRKKIFKSLKYLVFIAFLVISVAVNRINPESFRKIGILSIIFANIFLCSFFYKDKFIDKTFDAISFFLLASFAVSPFFDAFYHSYEIDAIRYGGSFRGLFAHKNICGAVSALCSLYYLYQLLLKPKSRKKIFLFFCLVFILFFTFSGASIGLFVSFCFLIYLFTNPQVPKSIFFSSSALVVVFSLCFVCLNPFKDENITSRIELQKDILADTGFTLFGTGYESYFKSGRDSLVNNIYSSLDWRTKAVNTHNGYIDLFINNGMTGLIIFVLIFIWPVIKKGLSKSATNASGLPSIASILVIFLCIQNLFEGNFYNPNNIGWFFIILCDIGVQSDETCKENISNNSILQRC